MNEVNQNRYMGIKVLYHLDGARSNGGFCIRNSRWLIIKGSTINPSPNDSLISNSNYELAYRNYKEARKMTDASNVLTDDFILLKGSKSQCLTILQATPSSLKHARESIREITNLDEILKVIQRIGSKVRV